MSEKLLLLSRYYRDRTVGPRRSKRQSWSTQRELRVGTKISGFRQTTRGRGFSPTRFNSCLRAIQMDKVFGAGNDCAVQSQNFRTEGWNFSDFRTVRGWIFRTVLDSPKA